MTFLGLSVLEVLAVFGAAAAGVTLLYLLKLLRRPVEVPFVRLWEEALAEKQTTRLFSQLRRWLSWLLALAVVALLALALGDPRVGMLASSGESRVVLVDASTSMRATDVGPTRFAAATAEVRRLIAELGPADRMMVVELAGSPRPLTALSADAAALEAGVRELAPRESGANLGAGLRFAADVLRGEPNPEVVVVSDGQLAAPPEAAQALARHGVTLSFLGVGASDENVGITAFAARRYPLDRGTSEVLLEVWNAGSSGAQVEITLLGDGRPVEVTPLTLAAGARTRRFVRDLSGVSSTLEARVRRTDGRPDHLPADDHAFALVPERRRPRVLVVTPGNLYLEAALLVDEALDVTEVPPERYGGAEPFEAVIFDRFVPPEAPTRPAIYLAPAPAAAWGPFAVGAAVERPRFERILRDHALVRWTALRDVNVARAHVLGLEAGDTVVAGDPRAPLLVAGRRGDAPFVAFAFDVRESDLPLRVAWPLLLLNALDGFAPTGAALVGTERAGARVHVRGVPGGAARVRAPSGAELELPVSDGTLTFSPAEAGFYAVTADGGPAPARRLVAVNGADPEETRVAPVRALAIGGAPWTAPRRGSVGVRERIWPYLAVAGLLALLVEWWTYHRRWTV